MIENRPVPLAEALTILEWYQAAGVDLAVGEVPIDRFARTAPMLPQRQRAPAVVFPPVGADSSPAETTALAASARTLEELRAVMDAYEGCVLRKRATQLVFADGNSGASVMLVGEGPGEQEDKIGRPFVGKAGQLLDRMLGAIGLDRTNVYIANMVPWRPPGNRDPSPEELALCAPFLHRQVELVAPRYLVTLGRVSSQALFGTTQTITRLRGQWRTLNVGSHQVEALPTLHPAYLLRTPGAKEQAWRDMLSLKLRLQKDIAAGG